MEKDLAVQNQKVFIGPRAVLELLSLYISCKCDRQHLAVTIDKPDSAELLVAVAREELLKHIFETLSLPVDL